MAHLQIVAATTRRSGDTARLADDPPADGRPRSREHRLAIKLGELYARGGQPAAALECFRRAADYLKRSSRTDDYLKVAERIAVLAPDDLALTRELAHLYLGKGDTKRALAKLQLCFKADARDVETLQLLAQAFQRLGQTSKTVSVYKELARVHEERGRAGDARAAWRKVQELAPGRPGGGDGPRRRRGPCRGAVPSGGDAALVRPFLGSARVRPHRHAAADARARSSRRPAPGARVRPRRRHRSSRACSAARRGRRRDPEAAHGDRRLREVRAARQGARAPPQGARARPGLPRGAREGARRLRRGGTAGRGGRRGRARRARPPRARGARPRARRLGPPGRARARAPGDRGAGSGRGGRRGRRSELLPLDAEELVLPPAMRWRPRTTRSRSPPRATRATRSSRTSRSGRRRSRRSTPASRSRSRRAAWTWPATRSPRPPRSPRRRRRRSSTRSRRRPRPAASRGGACPRPPRRSRRRRAAALARGACAVPGASSRRTEGYRAEGDRPRGHPHHRGRPRQSRRSPPRARASRRRRTSRTSSRRPSSSWSRGSSAPRRTRSGTSSPRTPVTRCSRRASPRSSGAPGEVHPPRPRRPSRRRARRRRSPSSGPDESFDIARELADELGGDAAPPEEEDFQYSVEDVFAEFKKGLEKVVQPEDIETHYDLGHRLQGDGAARRRHRRVRGRAPGLPASGAPSTASSMIGLCRMAKGDHREAIRAFRRALASDAAHEGGGSGGPVRARGGPRGGGARRRSASGSCSASRSSIRRSATSPGSASQRARRRAGPTRPRTRADGARPPPSPAAPAEAPAARREEERRVPVVPKDAA